MALIRDYELPGTGVTIPNAYHVITKIEVEKRIQDEVGPKDTSRPDERTAGHQLPGREIYWKAGYIGKIAITIWKDAAARQAGINPLGFIGVNPTDNKYYAIGTTTTHDTACMFFVDITSTKNEVEQAYDYLLTTPYYSGSTLA